MLICIVSSIIIFGMADVWSAHWSSTLLLRVTERAVDGWPAEHNPLSPVVLLSNGCTLVLPMCTNNRVASSSSLHKAMYCNILYFNASFFPFSHLSLKQQKQESCRSLLSSRAALVFCSVGNGCSMNAHVRVRSARIQNRQHLQLKNIIFRSY